MMIGRRLKGATERDQRFIAKRSADELHADRQPRPRLPGGHDQDGTPRKFTGRIKRVIA
jgi:hypothetical protein